MDITDNATGQGSTSPSPCTHVQGAFGAPIGCRRGAADCPWSMQRTSLGTYSSGGARVEGPEPWSLGLGSSLSPWQGSRRSRSLNGRFS